MGLDSSLYEIDANLITANFGFIKGNNYYKIKNASVELAYWRKHFSLNCWMNEMYERKGGKDLQLDSVVVVDLNDLNELEMFIKSQKNEDWSRYERPEDQELDIQVIQKAKQSILNEKKVYYYASW